MGARNMGRTLLICFHLSCFTSMLAPASVDPPASNYTRGQPEIQQPLDNFPVGPMVIKSLDFPSGDGRGYPMLLTNKTSTLLSEALHMLNRVKNLKERRWVEAFIHRLGSLAATLEESTNRNNAHYSETNALMPVSSKLQQILPTLSVPKVSKMMAKYPMPSFQMNEVLPKNDAIMNRKVVAKPELLPLKTEPVEDELVRQLQEEARLHHNRVSSVQNNPLISHQETSLDMNTPPTHLTTPAPPAKNDVTESDTPKVEKEKANAMTRLFNDVTDLKRLGGTEEEILKSLKLDNHNLADLSNPEIMFDQHHITDEADEFEIAEDDQDEDEEKAQGLDIEKNELSISSPNSSFRKQTIEAIHNPLLPNQQNSALIPNSISQRSHTPTLTDGPTQTHHRSPNPTSHIPDIPQNNYQQAADGGQDIRATDGGQNMRQQTPDGQNIRQLATDGENIKQQAPGEEQYMHQQAPDWQNMRQQAPGWGQNMRQQETYGQRHYYPRFLPQRPNLANINMGQPLQPQFRVPEAFAAQQAYMNSLPRDHYFYGPPVPRRYPVMNPYFSHPQPKHYNVTMQQPLLMLPPYPPIHYQYPYPNPRLTDEMERQLRDGKIVVLSDSLVRTNFGENEKEKKDGPKGNVSSQVLDEGDTVEGPPLRN